NNYFRSPGRCNKYRCKAQVVLGYAIQWFYLVRLFKAGAVFILVVFFSHLRKVKQGVLGKIKFSRLIFYDNRILKCRCNPVSKTIVVNPENDAKSIGKANQHFIVYIGDMLSFFGNR